MRLTADLIGVGKSLCDIRVHANQKIVLACKLFMPSSDMGVYPVLELLPEPCIDHICKPLTRQKVNLSLVRQIQHKFGKLLSFLKHSPYRNVLILWTVNWCMLVLLDVYVIQLWPLETYTSFRRCRVTSGSMLWRRHGHQASRPGNQRQGTGNIPSWI